MQPDPDIDKVLEGLAAGDPGAAERLYPLVYDRLRTLAAGHMRRGKGGVTLQPTAVVHEAYMRLQRREEPWAGRSHFMAVAASAIRQVLIDAARRRSTAKRGGDAKERTYIDGAGISAAAPAYDFLDLEQALQELAQVNARHARVVELRFFGGLSVVETAEVIGRSATIVKADWALARTWLEQRLGSST